MAGATYGPPEPQIKSPPERVSCQNYPNRSPRGGHDWLATCLPVARLFDASITRTTSKNEVEQRSRGGTPGPTGVHRAGCDDRHLPSIGSDVTLVSPHYRGPNHQPPGAFDSPSREGWPDARREGGHAALQLNLDAGVTLSVLLHG